MVAIQEKHSKLNTWNVLDKILFGLFCLKAFIHLVSVLELVLNQTPWAFVFGAYTSIFSFVSTYPLYALVWYKTRRLDPNPIVNPERTRKLLRVLLFCDLMIALAILGLYFR